MSWKRGSDRGKMMCKRDKGLCTGRWKVELKRDWSRLKHLNYFHLRKAVPQFFPLSPSHASLPCRGSSPWGQQSTRPVEIVCARVKCLSNVVSVCFRVCASETGKCPPVLSSQTHSHTYTSLASVIVCSVIWQWLCLAYTSTCHVTVSLPLCIAEFNMKSSQKSLEKP